jgi:hypothetical protein
MTRIPTSTRWLAAAVAVAIPWQAAAVDPVVEVEYRRTVVLDETGFAAVSETFPTRLVGDVRHDVVVETPCRSNGKCGKGTAVFSVAVLLDNELVLNEVLPGPLPERETTQVALEPVGGALNNITVSSIGEPGAGVRVSVIARTLPVRKTLGRSVLPDATATTDLVLHNVGTANRDLAGHLLFYGPDGLLAGRSPAMLIAAHASALVNLGIAGGSVGWTAGPVHFEWVSLGDNEVSAVAIDGTDRLPLDDLAKDIVAPVKFAEIAAGLLD